VPHGAGERAHEGAERRRVEARRVVGAHVDERAIELLERDLTVAVAVRRVVGRGLLGEAERRLDRGVGRRLEAVVEEVIAVRRELGRVGRSARDDDAERVLAVLLDVAARVARRGREAPVERLPRRALLGGALDVEREAALHHRREVVRRARDDDRVRRGRGDRVRDVLVRLRLEPRERREHLAAGLRVVRHARPIERRRERAGRVGHRERGVHDEELVVVEAPAVDEAALARRVRGDLVLDVVLAPGRELLVARAGVPGRVAAAAREGERDRRRRDRHESARDHSAPPFA
jgi:hypothetical protein